jgi:TRAP-type mannitol/chloroaromatic compound transport system permease large subunit
MMATIFAIYIFVRCRLQPHMGPALPEAERAKVTLSDKLSLLREGLLPLLVFGTMMGLFLSGITSLVESSVVGATLATLAALIERKLTWTVFEDTTRKTLGITCMFLWVILAALLFGAVYDGLGAVRAIETLLLDTWDLTPWAILVLMLLSFIVMGMFLDDTAMLIIVAPLYIPLVIELGFDAIWFGILYTMTCQMAYITPPFGYNLFLMRAMAPPEITLLDIYRSIIPFFLMMVLSVVIVMMFPQIALWLPNLYSGE